MNANGFSSNHAAVTAVTAAPSLRCAVLAGVSSDAQAREDKASIPDQIKTCQRTIEQLGGSEIAVYVMDGYSRTGYDSLADAMGDIPPLRQAIQAAEQDRYDVLIVDNWDRLGDLGQLVNTRFRKYRKQIYSARQSGRVQDPATYDPYSDESADIDMHIEGIIQRYRINKMRRGWSVGMPKRIEKGLTPLRVPFAYIWVSPKEPAKLDPARGALVQQMKDLLFKGRSLREITRHANESGFPPPNGGAEWDRSTIRYILANPFYAGIVGIHRGKYIYDPTRKIKKRLVKRPRSEWVEGKGKHQPLWDEATHHQILKELERRTQINKRSATRFPLSGLLICSECKCKLYRRTHSARNYERIKVMSCQAGPAHVIIPYDDCVDLVARELVRQLGGCPVEPGRSVPDPDHTQNALSELALQRRRVQEGYKAGIYNDAEAVEEIGRIERQIGLVVMQEQGRQAAKTQAEPGEEVRVDWSVLPAWIQSDDPQIVHRLLSAVLETIVIDSDWTVEIVWRGDER